MIGFDFEVFKYNWLVVFKDIVSGNYTVIVDNMEQLKEYYEKHKDNLFIGYNNSNYDNYILKAILKDIDPYYISHIIINQSNQNYRLQKITNWSDIPLYTYDVSFGLGYTSLKENEAYLGISIDECPISFEKTTELTKEELEKVIEYCKRDVDATCLLFEKSRSEFQTKLYLCKEFQLDKSYLNKSSQKIIEKVLGAERKYYCTDGNDPFDFSQLNLKIKKYQAVVDYFKLPVDEQKGFSMDICGVPHNFGIGGIHGAIPNYKYTGKLMIIDVASYYPSMMISYDWFARSIPREHRLMYSKMKADRIVLKKTNKPLSDAYKLILNTTYGCYKYEYGNLYDPRMANNICIAGQVMLVDLLEQIEPYCKLVQSNTDGIIIIPYNEEKIRECVADWEIRSKVKMEISYGEKIVEKDVNNYIFKTEKGIKAVGGYVKQYKPKAQELRRTCSIIDKALVEHLVNDVSIEDYIHSNNDPLDYQIISKVGRTYDRVFLEKDGIEIPVNFVNRTFAGFESGRLYKQKNGKNRELVANQPPLAFIWDKDISELDITKVDKQWYIDMAYKRLNDYLEGRK